MPTRGASCVRIWPGRQREHTTTSHLGSLPTRRLIKEPEKGARPLDLEQTHHPNYGQGSPGPGAEGGKLTLPELIAFFLSADLPVAPFLSYLLFESFMWDYCLSVNLGCWEKREVRVTVCSNPGRGKAAAVRAEGLGFWMRLSCSPHH